MTGCLQVFSKSGTWSIYIDEGKLIYACYSENMFEMLYRNLQSLSQQVSTLPQGIDEQLRAIFETEIENQSIPNPDYLAICWLVSQQYISPSQAAILIEQLALEVLESFLSLEEGSFEFIPDTFLDDMPKYCHLNLRLLVEHCQNDGSDRPYLQTSQQVNQPRYPTPTITKTPGVSDVNQAPSFHKNINNTYNNYQQPQTPVEKKPYKIFCIDDSPAVIDTIKNYLDDQIFTVTGVTNSLNALMQILHAKPDIILLDIDMPNLDGYELCSLLRKHSRFKHTPVIMVTAKTGLLDRVKAKLVKASGFLAKPFSQGDLLKTIFQHIV